MSLSQRRRWQEDFARLQAQFQQRSVIPIDRRTPGVVEGVKAGLSLTALSPEPVAGKVLDGQECYDSSGTLVTGNFVYDIDVKIWTDNAEGGLFTRANAYETVFTYDTPRAIKTIYLDVMKKQIAVGGTSYLKVLEGAVEVIAPFSWGQMDWTAEAQKSFTPSSATSSINVQMYQSSGNKAMVKGRAADKKFLHQ